MSSGTFHMRADAQARRLSRSKLTRRGRVAAIAATVLGFMLACSSIRAQSKHTFTDGEYESFSDNDFNSLAHCFGNDCYLTPGRTLADVLLYTFQLRSQVWQLQDETASLRLELESLKTSVGVKNRHMKDADNNIYNCHNSPDDVATFTCQLQFVHNSQR